MRVLVTDGDERAALAATRSLGRVAETHAVANGARCLAGASRFCHASHPAPDPLRDPDAFVLRIAQLVADRGIDAVVPVTDAATRALLPGRERFAPAVLAAPSLAAYERISDKTAAATLSRELGLELPEGSEARNADEALEVARHLGWPVILKPAHSVLIEEDESRRKTRVVRVRDTEELRAVWPIVSGRGAALVQRIVPGWGEGLFLLRWGGQTRAVFAHRRLREKPPAGGISVLRESIAVDPERQRRVEAALDHAGFDGVAMAEFKTNGRRAWLMEFNARLWGSLQLAIDAGVDFPRLLVEAALARPAGPSPSFSVGVRSRWLLGDLDHAIALTRGHVAPDGSTGLSAALSVLLRPAGPRCRWEVLRRDDPRPFLREIAMWWSEPRRNRDRGGAAPTGQFA